MGTTGSFPSVTQPIEYNAPLLVAFKKVRFPQYNIIASENSLVFGSIYNFRCWEAALELRYLLDSSLKVPISISYC